MLVSEELKAFKRAFWILLAVFIVICFVAMKKDVRIAELEEQNAGLIEIIENLKEAKDEGN